MIMRSLLLLFLVINALGAFAQSQSEVLKPDLRGIRNVFWAEAGFGMSNEGWVGGLSGTVETIKNVVITAGVSNLDKGDLRPESSYFERQSWYAGVGYVNKAGQSLKVFTLSLSSSDFTHAVFSGRYNQAGSPEHDFIPSSTMGIRLDARIIPNNGWAGLSFNPFVDLNGTQSIVGAQVMIALGRLW
jgi:hypothetical protein